EDIPQIVDAVATTYRLDFGNAPHSDRRDIALQELSLRDRRDARKTRLAIVGFVLFALITVIAILTRSNASPSTRSDAEQRILEIKDNLATLRGNFELISSTANADTSTLTTKTREQAESYARDMLAVSDKRLDPGHLITKWEYASYAYAMAACLATKDEDRLSFAREVVRTAKYASVLIEWVNSEAGTGDTNFRNLKSFLEDNSDASRTQYLIAIGLAIVATYDKGVLLAEVHEAIDKIPKSFRRDWPIS